MFRQLIRFDEAKEIILDRLSPKPIEVEQMPLVEAVGRVLAEDVVSPTNVPPFDRSTVDGYAVRAEDTFGAHEDNPTLLKSLGHGEIGEMPKITLKKGCAVGVATGGPLPANADAVVMLENAVGDEKKLAVYRPVVKGENVMESGSDIYKGETILKKGTALSSRIIGVLASTGFASVNVFKQPRVAVISTGPEIMELGQPLPSGKIYDINRYTLVAAVLENGGKPLDYGIVGEHDEKLLVKTLKAALEAADIVITSGGVSVGPRDMMPKLVDGLGSPGLVIHGVAVKPGKPIAVAIIGRTPVFLLPGHPTSSLLMFHLLVCPVLSRIGGGRGNSRPPLEAIVSEKLFSAPGRRTFIMVALSRDDMGRLRARRVHTGESGAITTLARADGYVVLSEEDQFIEAGERVSVFPF